MPPQDVSIAEWLFLPETEEVFASYINLVLDLIFFFVRWHNLALFFPTIDIMMSVQM